MSGREDPVRTAEAFAVALRGAKHRRRPLVSALICMHRGAFAVSVAFGLVHALTSLAAPYFLRELLAWLQAPDETLREGLLLASAIFVAGATSWLAIAHCFFLGEKVALRIRSGLVASIYNKTLAMPLHAAQATAGRVLNLVSTDVERVCNAPGAASVAVMSFAIMAIAIGMLWNLLGVTSLAGVAVLAALLPMSSIGARWMHVSVTRAAQVGDKRVGLLGDVLRGIRVVKLAAWESALGRKVEQLRNHEISALRRFSLVSAALNSLFLSAPIVVAFAVFGVNAALGRSLDMATVFSAIAVFGLLRPVLLHLPTVVSNIVQVRASLHRIEGLLAESEVDPARTSMRAPGSIRLVAASIGWNDLPVVSDVDLDVHPGELVVVCGTVGAGKSTLVNALLGNATAVDGQLDISGKIALVPQEPFLINGTVRDNILFGAEVEHDRYRAALVASRLDDDLCAMAAGDATEIGDRGSNLSGGQRQRLSLARAVYSNADVIIMDDPFNSLDAVVAAEVIERAIFGACGAKTRILVTHRRDIAQRADKVILLEGGLFVCGPPAAVLTSMPAGSFGTQTAPSLSSRSEETTAANEADAFTSTEQRGHGALSLATYSFYLRALAPKVIAITLLLLFAGREVLAITTDYLLSSWSAGMHAPTATFIVGFAVVALVTVVVTCARGALGATRGLAAASALHAAQVRGLLRSPLAFFGTTPSGQLVNRLSRDQRVIDQELSGILFEWLGSLALVLSTIVVIVAASPIALVAILLVGLRYYQIQRYFRASVRDIRRLDAVARSPLMVHFAETLGGIVSIRAFRAEQQFAQTARSKLDPSQRTTYVQDSVKAWITVRLDLLGSSLAGVAAVVAVFGRDSVDPRLSALAITYAMVITYTLGRVVRTSLDVESSMSAVERVKEYADLPSERWTGDVEPPTTWPASGAIDFKRVSLRYRPGLPLAVRGVSMRIAPGEKVAIVGRTGSGKSSMIAALFRLTELTSGAIRVDGMDVARLPLTRLRERLTVIPQDPFIFQGTIRENLDPTGIANDDGALWHVLRRAHADGVVSALPKGLDTEIGGGAAILSAGQRQLLCLARALLRPTSVLVLDEVTASVDHATDATVWEMILREFANSTVIMIAHRLDAADSCDRVVVMDEGRIVEQGSPDALRKDPRGAFARLADAYSRSAHH